MYPPKPISSSPGRIWNSQAEDDGSLHCLGNGRLCAYEQGPQIVQVFGPPYSAPSLGQLCLDTGEALQVHSIREPGSPIWRHSLRRNGAPLGEIVDFVDSRLACLVRQLFLNQPLALHLVVELPARRVQNRPVGADCGWLFEVPAGLFFFHEYPVPFPAFYQAVWQGQVETSSQEDGVRLVCPAGESVLFLAGGPAYPQAVETAEQAMQIDVTNLLIRTRQDWQAFCWLPQGVREPLWGCFITS